MSFENFCLISVGDAENRKARPEFMELSKLSFRVEQVEPASDESKQGRWEVDCQM